MAVPILLLPFAFPPVTTADITAAQQITCSAIGFSAAEITGIKAVATDIAITALFSMRARIA